MRRLPIRTRLTVAFAAVMTALFCWIATSLYTQSATALLDELDSGLRVRAAFFEAEASSLPTLTAPARGLIEPREAFAQIAGLDGRVLRSSPLLTTALLDPKELNRAGSARYFVRRVPGVAGMARLLAVPFDVQSTRTVLIVGTTMSDRSDALGHLRNFLAVTGPLSILLASIAGWAVAGLALRPVERMRRQASAISASGTDRRLTLPSAHDEIRRLAVTLNAMLSGLDNALQAERRFVNRASHELRTPLTALKAELDVALSRPRSAEELTTTLHSASEEADRLTRLANDLLVLARANHGRLSIHREPVAICQLLEASAGLFRASAAAAGVSIETAAPAGEVSVDPTRVRQAIDNLLANALRFSPTGTTIRLEAMIGDRDAKHAPTDALEVRITVSDQGSGLQTAPRLAPEAEPLEHAGGASGLGLAIVRAVAAGHGGAFSIDNNEGGGARAVMTLTAAASLPPKKTNG